MSTVSGTTNYSATRDNIIYRAFRIIGAIGQAETPNSAAITEAAQALNDLVKEFQTDGMQLWKYASCSAITYTATTNAYAIGTGATLNQQAPLKVLQAWNRNIATSYDIPILLITKQEYAMLSNKTSAGTPNQLLYVPPGPPSTQMVGNIFVYPTPDTNAAATFNLYLECLFAIDDFNTSTDLVDFPSYYYNAIVWGLADQLSYEYGVPYAQQSMIANKAAMHLQKALSFDREEGSIYIQPDWQIQHE